MIYKAIVQDGGVFIPNLAAHLAAENDIKHGDQLDIKIASIAKSTLNEPADSLELGIGLFKRHNIAIDGVLFQNQVRYEWSIIN